MSESHEPSYYEIALTNRQVVVAFVILLICLMGTFFSGVWVGRGEASVVAAPPEEQRQSDDGGVEPLDFFGGGDGERPGDPASGEERREPQRQLQGQLPADDLAGGEGAALPAGAPTAVPATPPAGPAGPAGDPATESKPQQRQQAAEPTPARPVEGPVVQVFSSNDRAQAQRTLERLQDAGQPAFMSPVEVDGQTMYRVRIGPFRDRAEAEKVADQVRRRYRLDTWITQ